MSGAVNSGLFYESVQRYFSPLKLCTLELWGRDDDFSVFITVRGSADLLVEKGFAVPRMFENLPRCGQRNYGGNSAMSAGVPFYASVQTTTDGFRVRRHLQGDELREWLDAIVENPAAFAPIWSIVTGKRKSEHVSR